MSKPPKGYITDPAFLETMKAIGFPPGSRLWQDNPWNNGTRGWIVAENQRMFMEVGTPHVVVMVPQDDKRFLWMPKEAIVGWKPLPKKRRTSSVAEQPLCKRKVRGSRPRSGTK